MKQKLQIHFFLFFLFSFLFSTEIKSQNCGGAVPTLVVDLTGSPDSVWISPDIQRNDNCCGTTNPDNCIQFILTLDPGAQSISFNIYSGAVPPGALFYQINCGPPQAVGLPICVDGIGPHNITFCKPGNNKNQYIITSIPAPGVPNSLIINDGCTGTISAAGYDPATITWNSIFPGNPGDYNSYLSCQSGCSTTTVLSQPGYPPYIDYQVCGIPSGACFPGTVCNNSRIYFNPTLFANILPLQPTVCYGETGTTITANGIGGTPPYNYLWNTGATTQSIYVDTGTYTVILGDASGCPPTTATVTVTGFSSPISANAGTDMVVCKESPLISLNGSITAAGGGKWSSGSGTFIPSDSALITSYYPTPAEINSGGISIFLTTTGNGSCPAVKDTVFIAFESFDGTIDVDFYNVSCFGLANGNAEAFVTGPSSGYTFNWNDPASTPGSVVTGLAPGTYQVTVTDDNGCIDYASVTINQPVPLISSVSGSNVSCNGGNNGTAIVNASGGTGGFTYSWAPSGGNSITATGLSAGTYSSIVRDANNCSTIAPVIINQPAPLIFTTVTTNMVSCFGGSNGSATVVMSGGISPYTYSWSPSGGTSSTATGLTSGTYITTVRDANSCLNSSIVSITQPATSLSSVTATTNVSCSGGNDGTATVSISGGTPGYTYSWSPVSSTSASANNLSAGTYNVNTKDLNGCQINSQVIVGSPAPLSCIINSTDAKCNLANGSASAAVSGGTPPYTYSWSNGPGTNTNPNISQGSYSVTVRDANNCSVVTNVTINNSSPPVTLTFNPANNVSCFGGNNGSTTVVATGTAPYTYSWFPVSGTGTTISSLAAGTYSVQVMDGNGCINTSSINITQPSASLSGLITSKKEVSCFNGNDGSLTVNASGGTAPYTYSWMPSSSSFPTINNLNPGTYSVQITDSKSCSFTVTETLLNPNLLNVSITTTNVSCTGGSNGAMLAVASGGTGPYSWLWSNGSTSQSLSGLSTGVFSVTVTDAKGCTKISSAGITQPSPLSISISTGNVSCSGGSNGQASSVVSGGTPPYSYNWTPGNLSTASITGLAAGTYSLQINDSSNCLASTGLVITEPAPLAGSVTTSPVNCFGGNDGSANVSVSGGTTPYGYVWTPGGSTGQTVQGLSAGLVSVSITDARGCTNNVSGFISQPGSGITISQTILNVNCNGGNNGSASLTVTGGTGNYSYSWSPAVSTGSSASGLTSGIYQIIINDENTCQALSTVNISQPPALTANTGNITNVSCFNGNNGSISLGISGGSPGYTIQWLPSGGSAPVASSLTAGTYTYNITDSKSCTFSGTAAITQPSAILSGTISGSNVSCNGYSDGSASISPSGGTAPYTYSWSAPGSALPSITGLFPGTYTSFIRDARGCLFSASIAIIQPNPISIDGDSINALCDSANGEISIVATGGTLPYTYSWNGGQTTPTINGLTAGNYVLNLTDGSGCLTAKTFLVNNIAGPDLTIGSTTNVSCFGDSNGTATANVLSGNPPYVFEWNTNPVQTGATATGLKAGEYTVTVTDSNGCKALAITTPKISEPSALYLSIEAIDAICFGTSTGIGTAGASGGIPPYEFLWSNSDTGLIGNGFPAGFHSVSLTDSNGCLKNESFEIKEPGDLVINFTNNNITCKGAETGSAMAIVTGGTAPYFYSWSSGGSASTETGLIVGSYTVDITDSLGCIKSGNTTLTEPMDSLSGIISSIIPVSCFNGSDGSATVTAAGGNPGYTYSWENGNTTNQSGGFSSGIHFVNITDSTGCSILVSELITEPDSLLAGINIIANASCYQYADGILQGTGSGGNPPYQFLWSPGGSSSMEGGLNSGTYNLNLTDSKGCTAIASESIIEPDPLYASIASIIMVSCRGGANGSAQAIGTGGTPPYNFFWNPGNINDSIINNLSAGAYSLTISDSNACQYDTTILITEPSEFLSLTINNLNNVSCFGGNDGKLLSAANGGTPGYSFIWTPGNIIGDSLMGAEGNYQVMVTDQKSCTAVASGIITSPDSIQSAFTLKNVSCNGGSDAMLTIIPTGGTSGYVPSWNGIIGNEFTIQDLDTGLYMVTITDANGCTHFNSMVVTEPTPVINSFLIKNVSCNGGNDGSAGANVSGGIPPYLYSWSPGPEDSSYYGSIGAGTYFLSILDSNNCNLTDTVTISQPDSLYISDISLKPVSCKSGSDGGATITITGGNGGYSWSWLPDGETINSISGKPAGTYYVNIVDSLGCNLSDTIEIIEPSDTISSSINTNPVSCFGGSNGMVSAEITGGIQPFTFTWNSIVSADSFVTGLNAGTYIMSYSDGYGCTGNINYQITEPDSILISFQTVSTKCKKDNGSILANVSGGTPGYTYSWNNGGTGPAITNLDNGNYLITILDSSGCIKTASIELTEVPGPNLILDSIKNVSCFGGADGMAKISTANGTPPYQLFWSPGGSGFESNDLIKGSYSVMINDSNNCMDTISFSIEQPQEVIPNISETKPVSCNGGSDGILNSTSSGGNPPYMYSWTPGGAITPDPNNLGSGSYTLLVTDANGCTGSKSYYLKEPQSLVTGSSKIKNINCNGGMDGSAFIQPAGGTVPYQYLWNTNPVQTTPLAENLNSGSYSVIITDKLGCTYSESIFLSQPNPIITNVSGDTVICKGSGSTLSATASGGSGNYFFAWKPGNEIANNIVVNPGQSGIYSVTAYDNYGCPGTTASIKVRVITLTPENLQVFGTSPICPGSSSVVYANVDDPGAGPLTYTWNNSLGTGPGAFQVTPDQPKWYTVTVVNSCNVSVTDSVLIDFKPLADVAISFQPGNGCAPHTAYFVDESQTADPIVSWNWVFGDGNTSTEENPLNIYSTQGQYNVTLTVLTAGGCLSTLSAGNSTVVVDPSPVADFTANPTVVFVPYDVANFNNISQGGVNYSWDFGDGTSSNQMSPQHSWTKIGTYQITLIATNEFGCKDTIVREVVATSNLVFPNVFTPDGSGPNGGAYDITSLDNNVFFPYTEGVEEYSLMIFNRWGELIFETFDYKTGWDGYYRGQLCQQDVYVWKVKAKFNDGRTFNKTGDVTLLK